MKTQRKDVFCQVCGQYLVSTKDPKDHPYETIDIPKTTEEFVDNASVEVCIYLENHLMRHALAATSGPTWSHLQFTKPKNPPF